MHRTHARFWTALLGAALLALPAAAQPRAGAQKGANPKLPVKKPADPVVLVLAMGAYTKLDKLQHTVPNGVAFARQIAKQGYRVTFVTDSGSVEAVKKELKDLPNGARVEAIDDSIGLEKAWRVWMEDRFLDPKAPSLAPFGFVVLAGHGEDRDLDDARTGTFFMAAGDEKGKGGISIRNVQQYCFERNLPVVMLVDICRKEQPRRAEPKQPPSGSETTLLILKDRGNRLGFSDERGVPLTIWSAWPSEVVIDQKRDMMAILSQGLEQAGAPPRRTFEAKQAVRPTGGGFFPPERDTDLSFQTWFRYGNRRAIDELPGGRSFAIDPGNIDQQMIFASTDRDRQGQLLALAAAKAELLDEWEYGAGEFTGKRTDRGLEVTHPEDANKVRYVIGVLKNEYPIKGKSLVIECMGVNPEVKADSGETLGVLFQPSADAGGKYFYSGWNRRIEVPYHRLSVIKVPLDQGNPGDQLTRMSFSADPQKPTGWPKGSTLLVTRMTLCDDALAKQIEVPPASAPVNLAARWWVGDVLRRDPSEAKLGVRFEAKDGRQAILFEGEGAKKDETYGRGGAVFPKLYADPLIHAVEVQLADCGVAGDTKFTLALHGKTEVLCEREIQVGAGRIGKPITVELKAPGFVEYIGLTTTDPKFKAKVVNLSLVSKPSKK